MDVTDGLYLIVMYTKMVAGDTQEAGEYMLVSAVLVSAVLLLVSAVLLLVSAVLLLVSSVSEYVLVSTC